MSSRCVNVVGLPAGCADDLSLRNWATVLPHKCTLFVVVEEFAHVFVDSDAACGQKFCAGPAAGFHADGPDASPAWGFGIVGGVAEGEAFVGDEAEMFEGCFEDVGVGLRAVGVIGGGLFFEEVLHIGDLFVGLDVLLAGGCLRC